MSTVALTDQPTVQTGRPDKVLRAIEPAQRTAAKVAACVYLLLYIPAIFAEIYVRGRLVVSGDAAQTATNIAASERLFRLATANDLIQVAGGVVLLLALYVVLKPINRNLALLAAFWELADCAMLAVLTLSDVVALSFLSGAGYLRAFDPGQLQALVYTSMRVHSVGYLIAMFFYGLGSALFAWLWFKSRYIPRALAALGIFGSLVLALGDLAIVVFPRLTAVLIPAYWGPLFAFEVAISIWLLVKGIRWPDHPMTRSPDDPMTRSSDNPMVGLAGCDG